MIFDNSFELKDGLSIVIPTYNKSELLKKTLLSLFEQTANQNLYEIIVVNDGSSDDTQEVVNKIKSKYKNLRYFLTPDDGFRVSRARNIGINAANYRHILLFDSGMIAAPTLVEYHLNIHQSDSNKVVLGMSYGVEETELSACEKIKSFLDRYSLMEAFERMKGVEGIQDCRFDYFKRLNFDLAILPAPWIICWTGHMSLSKKLATSVGGFDEWFTSWGGEDVEFGYRLFHAGGKFIMLKDILSIHYPHPKDSEKKEASGKENLKYIIAKHPDFYMKKLQTQTWQAICDQMLEDECAVV